eukprot:15001826-Heterocapsa_arctica.AAC.1
MRWTSASSQKPQIPGTRVHPSASAMAISPAPLQCARLHQKRSVLPYLPSAALAKDAHSVAGQ